MTFLRFVFVIAAFVFGLSAHAASLEEMIKQRHDMTHSLVRKDSTFQKSIQEILPNGVFRVSAEDFSKRVKFASFVVGKANVSEVKQALGDPIGDSQEENGRFVYSYDAPQTIVTYVFTVNGMLDASYGYSLPWK